LSMGFPLHYYNINMEYNSIKIIKFMKGLHVQRDMQNDKIY